MAQRNPVAVVKNFSGVAIQDERTDVDVPGFLRAILFTVALIVVGLGAMFFLMQRAGLIDRSSLYLIALMVAPFTPALLVLPFRVTFKNYLASGKA